MNESKAPVDFFKTLNDRMKDFSDRVAATDFALCNGKSANSPARKSKLALPSCQSPYSLTATFP